MQTSHQKDSRPFLKLSHFRNAKADLEKRINLHRLQKWDEEIRNFVSRRNKAAGFIRE